MGGLAGDPLGIAAAGEGRVAVLVEGAPRKIQVVSVDWDAAATAVVSTLDVPAATTWIGAADLDGDGDRDLVLILAGSPAALRAAHGDGAGAFVLAPGQLDLPFDLADGARPGFDAADFAPEAGEEIVIGADGAEGLVAVAAGGPVPVVSWAPDVPDATTDLAVFDRYDDGLPDLVAARLGVAPARYYEGVEPGPFEPTGSNLYGFIAHDDAQRIAAVRSGTGPDVAFAVWRAGSKTIVLRHSAARATPLFHGIAGNYASGVVGIDANDVEPARFVLWGPDGIVVVAASVPRGANGCQEATVDPGAPPLWVTPFAGQPGAPPLDLAVLRETDPPSLLLLRR